MEKEQAWLLATQHGSWHAAWTAYRGFITGGILLRGHGDVHVFFERKPYPPDLGDPYGWSADDPEHFIFRDHMMTVDTINSFFKNDKIRIAEIIYSGDRVIVSSPEAIREEGVSDHTDAVQRSGIGVRVMSDVYYDWGDLCDHDDYEADILTGRATCTMCGYHWWQTDDEIKREQERQVAYDAYCAGLEKSENIKPAQDGSHEQDGGSDCGASCGSR